MEGEEFVAWQPDQRRLAVGSERRQHRQPAGNLPDPQAVARDETQRLRCRLAREVATSGGAMVIVSDANTEQGDESHGEGTSPTVSSVSSIVASGRASSSRKTTILTLYRALG
ncbi:MAG: hypothetical protein AW07_04253 [Candidatus Accumulibacter sp. SK-11]|nr:MAG: hypothetical protein AW07_04253 [Candidatus Accumulibacter sp. SK-11]